MEDEFLLIVKEAYTRDVGKCIARIDYGTMDSLNIATGDIIEIIGKKTIIGKALPLYPSDEHKQMIRIDGMSRHNLNAIVDERITVRKTTYKIAEEITVEALEALPPIEPKYIAECLEQIPIRKDNEFFMPYFGGRIILKVIDTMPEGNVVVNLETRIKIKLNENIQFKSAYDVLEKKEKEVKQKLYNKLTVGAERPTFIPEIIVLLNELSKIQNVRTNIIKLRFNEEEKDKNN